MAANITLNTIVYSTEQVLDPSGSGLHTNRRTEQSFQHTMTTSTYSTVCTNAGLEIMAYIQVKVSGTVNSILGEIVVENIDAAEYATPRTYWSGIYATPTDANEAFVNPATSEHRRSFNLAPSDYTTGVVLGTALSAQVLGAINSVQ